MADIEVRASGETIRSSPRDRVVVRLPENGSTGYQWSITEITDPLEVESDELVLPSELVRGAAGQRVVTIRARGIGRGRVALKLQRRWESEPVEHFELEVDVADD